MPERRMALFDRRRLQVADEICRDDDGCRGWNKNQTKQGAAKCL
jgi:hypothetical protein